MQVPGLAWVVGVAVQAGDGIPVRLTVRRTPPLWPCMLMVMQAKGLGEEATMPARSWGHRERLLAFGVFGILLAVCGAIATAIGAASGPGVAFVGTVLACWEGLALWLAGAYEQRSRHR